MKIMHYFLGFPPYRTGGLTKYAFDLMRAQVEDNNDVVALWPGEIKKISGRPSIKARGSIHGIENYELINPLPVPLDEGINEFSAFTKKCEIQIYQSFLSSIKPDVIHIHTLMGIHKEFIEAANRLDIRTVYTSHDYFGLCPKVTLYCNGECCDDDQNCNRCIQCNSKALSLKKIQIMQSPMYRKVKNTSLVKRIRKRHRGDFFSDESVPIITDNTNQLANKYHELRTYYVSMYESVDLIHFNSSIAEKVFKRFVTPKNSRVVSITHQDIEDNRNNIHIPSNELRILYLSPAKPFKGFGILKAALDELWKEGKRFFTLNMYCPVPNPLPYMRIKEDGYSYAELPDIFANTDVLVAPSIWYETFGFTVLEAISFGVPVIVSDHVGAKDIIGSDSIVVKSGSVHELKEAVILMEKRINSHEYRKQMKVEAIKTWDKFVRENYYLYLK